jgi:membrane protein
MAQAPTFNTGVALAPPAPDLPPSHPIRLADCSALVAQVWKSWREDYVTSMGAALAYYTMFSLAPLLLIVISVAGLVFGEAAARGEIQAELDGLMGPHSASAIQDLLSSVHQPAKGLAATLLGLVLLLVGAATVFGELQDALDRIWRVPSKEPANGWLSFLRARLLSYGMILALGFLLTVSLVASAMLAAVGHTLNPLFGAWQSMLALVSAISSFFLAGLVFALIFKLVPRVHVLWRDVWIGALFTAGLFTLGKTLIGLYIGRSGVASGFGAAGSLVVVLLWVYWSAQILLIGAEFTWVYANLFGSRKGLAASDAAQTSVPSPIRP